LVEQLVSYVRSKAFTAAKVDKIFWGYRLCQLIKNYRHFRDWGLPLMTGPEMVPEPSVTFNQWTRPIDREDLIKLS
jgi:hypothetical protein